MEKSIASEAPIPLLDISDPMHPAARPRHVPWQDPSDAREATL
jgi:hypothetical protein